MNNICKICKKEIIPGESFRWNKGPYHVGCDIVEEKHFIGKLKNYINKIRKTLKK